MVGYNGENMAFKARQTKSEYQPCHSLAVWPWAVQFSLPQRALLSPLQRVLLPSCGECDQQAASSCQLLQGPLQLERTLLPGSCPSQGSLHLVKKQEGDIKAQKFWLVQDTLMVRMGPELTPINQSFIKLSSDLHFSLCPTLLSPSYTCSNP